MPKSSKITIRLSSKQLDNFKTIAIKDNISVSEAIRRASIKNYYKDIVNEQFYNDILYQINKIGNNLNQIAYKANISNNIDIYSIKLLVSIQTSLNDVLNGINNHIKRC